MDEHELKMEEPTPEVKTFIENQIQSLLRQRAQIDQKINALSNTIGVSAPVLTGNDKGSEGSSSSNGGTTQFINAGKGKIEPDSFYGMKVPQAILKYLGLVGKPPRAAIDIQKGLDDGGLKLNQQNAYSLVYNSLLRLEQVAKIIRVNNLWGLKEWYPHIEKTFPPNKEKELLKQKAAKSKKKPVKKSEKMEKAEKVEPPSEE